MTVTTSKRRTDGHRGPAMGTSCHIVVTEAPVGLLDRLAARLDMLEARWSRFIDSSEISLLNRRPDAWHLVSPETALLVERGRQGYLRTDGAFDPSILDALEAHGYRQSFDDLPQPVAARSALPSVGCAGIDVDRETGLVRLGHGVRFDPGGIGKGLAADLLVADALDQGARGALVNIGGDLACAGAAPCATAWTAAVHEPSISSRQLGVIALASGAVATSTTKRRRWRTADGDHHHLLDPSTGANASGVALATVVAAEAWWAEVVAKQLVVCGVDTDVDTTCAAALVVDDDGRSHGIGEIARYLR